MECKYLFWYFLEIRSRSYLIFSNLKLVSLYVQMKIINNLNNFNSEIRQVLKRHSVNYNVT